MSAAPPSPWPRRSPDWPATADLAYQATGPITEGPVLAEAHLVRRGSKTVVVEVDVFDGRGGEDTAVAAPAGAGVMTFGRLPGSASAIRIDPKQNMGRSSSARGDSHLSTRSPRRDRLARDRRRDRAGGAGQE